MRLFDQTRLRNYVLAPDEMMRFLAGEIRETSIPKDAILVQVTSTYAIRGVICTMFHESFDEVEQACQIPSFPMVLEAAPSPAPDTGA